jgi:hypothetical protein
LSCLFLLFQFFSPHHSLSLYAVFNLLQPSTSFDQFFFSRSLDAQLHNFIKHCCNKMKKWNFIMRSFVKMLMNSILSFVKSWIKILFFFINKEKTFFTLLHSHCIKIDIRKNTVNEFFYLFFVLKIFSAQCEILTRALYVW